MIRHSLSFRRNGYSAARRTRLLLQLTALLTALLALGSCSGGNTAVPEQGNDPIIVAWLQTFGSDQNLGSTIDASGSWSTEGDVSYDYDMDGDGSYEILDGDSVEVWVYPTAGEYTVVLRVTDPAGNSATDTATARPVNESTGDGSGGGEAGAPIAKLNIYWAEGGNAFRTLDASSSWAQDGSDLTYDYDIDGDGSYEVLAGPVTLEYEYPQAGSYTTVLRVTDGSGNSATASVTETIEATDPDAWDPSDLAPVVKLQAYWADGGEAYRTIDAQSSWARTGDDLTYDYDMNDDGTFEIKGGEPVFVHRFPGPGTYRIWLRVADESGNSGSTSIEVEIGASAAAPVGGGAPGGGDPDPGTNDGSGPPIAKLNIYWAEGGNFFRTLDASSSWAQDGSNLIYDYDINGDGNYEIKGGQKTMVYEFPAAGDYTVVLRVTDGSGNSATSSFTETIVPPDPGAWDPSDLAPVVKLQAYWADGGDEYRTIDAQSSWARTGDDLTYDYDMNDDGTFEIMGGEPVFVHRFPGAGSYRIWLRVTDESGNSGTTSTVVEV